MNTKSKDLIQIAKQYCKESQFNIAYACVGGSVGRGDADDYSDIDLTIYTGDRFVDKLIDIYYGNKIIQLEVKHTCEIPSIQAINDSPWDNRFLIETRVLKDNNNRFMQIKKQAKDHFSSIKGREKMVEQVNEIVKERELFALDSLNKNKTYTAAVAAMGAWTEAAFLYLFLTEKSLATGCLIPLMQKKENHFQAFTDAATFSLEANSSKILLIIKEFRTHLRKTHPFTFELSEIQDQLCERKGNRLLDESESFNLLWQMYGEALWLYFETNNGKSFEQYVDGLPDYLQKGLSDIGFKSIDEKNVKVLGNLSAELLHLCAENLN